jgi:hypothetical protein
MKSVVVVPAPPPAREGQEAYLPQPAEAAESTTAAASANAVEGIVGEVGSSSPRSVAANADEVLVPEESIAAL